MRFSPATQIPLINIYTHEHTNRVYVSVNVAQRWFSFRSVLKVNTPHISVNALLLVKHLKLLFSLLAKATGFQWEWVCETTVTVSHMSKHLFVDFLTYFCSQQLKCGKWKTAESRLLHTCRLQDLACQSAASEQNREAVCVKSYWQTDAAFIQEIHAGNHQAHNSEAGCRGAPSDLNYSWLRTGVSWGTASSAAAVVTARTRAPTLCHVISWKHLRSNPQSDMCACCPDCVPCVCEIVGLLSDLDEGLDCTVDASVNLKKVSVEWVSIGFITGNYSLQAQQREGRSSTITFILCTSCQSGEIKLSFIILDCQV